MGAGEIAERIRLLHAVTGAEIAEGIRLLHAVTGAAKAKITAVRRNRPAHIKLRTVEVLAVILSAVLLIAGAGRSVTGADYRRMADSAVARGDYAEASRDYHLEAQIYRSHGDLQGAAVEEEKAARWSTHIQMFVDAPPDRSAQLAFYTGKKFEPVYGCYLGAYVAGDNSLGGGGEYGNAIYANRAAALGERIGKPLATSWDYANYGRPFPLRWAQALLNDGIAPRIALEPNNGLSRVRDDAYLEQFARDAASCGGPIFLRFAGEMNGDWTAWHNDPSLYKAKFRLVHDVMARLAPNVAMIWCVNQVPEYNMDDYYPGDAYVDWVGVNFYSVLHHDNDPARPAGFENPASLLEYVYHKYAARKPIAICEYGASHRERLDPAVDYSVLAADKLTELFSALPREFPRVKMVGIFDNDNLNGADVMPGRALNDYSVTDSDVMLAALTRCVAPDYFLPAVETGVQQALPTWTRPLTVGAHLSGVEHLSAWVKTYEDAPLLIYRLDGREVARVRGPGECRADLDTSLYAPGKHILSLQVLDSHGRTAGTEVVAVTLA